MHPLSIGFILHTESGARTLIRLRENIYRIDSEIQMEIGISFQGDRSTAIGTMNNNQRWIINVTGRENMGLSKAAIKGNWIVVDL